MILLKFYEFFCLIDNKDKGYIACIISIISFFFKILLLYKILRSSQKLNSLNKIISLILFIFFGELLSDLSWSLESITHILSLSQLYFSICFTRLAWAFYIIEFQALSFLLSYLNTKSIKWEKKHIPFYTVNVILFIYFVVRAIFYYSSIDIQSRMFEMRIIKIVSVYVFFTLVPVMMMCIKNLRKTEMPRLLKRHVSILVFYLLIPKLILEYLQNNWWMSINFPPPNFGIVGFTVLFNTYILYFCITRLLRLRFLNNQNRVSIPRKERTIFATYMSSLMPRILLASDQQHFTELLKKGLHTLFKVPEELITVWVEPACFAYAYFEPTVDYKNFKKSLELFRTMHHPLESESGAFLSTERIAIRDELEFTHFYEPDEKYEKILAFMDEVNADVLIPLYESGTLLTLIVIHKKARKELYNNRDCDEMIVFAHYVNTALLTFKYKRFESLAAQHKMLQELVYFKDQHAVHYRETIRGLHQERVEKALGMVNYHDKQLSASTPATVDILEYDFTYEYQPLVSILQKIGQTVVNYRQSYEQIFKNPLGKDIRLIGMPGEGKGCSIAVIPLDAIERVKNRESLIADSSDRELLLFLEVTSTGKMINELIPGTDPTIIAIKIALLKVIMSKKEFLMTVSRLDMQMLVTFIHHMGNRTGLKFLSLTEKEVKDEYSKIIFGTHSSFDTSTAIGLLEQLKDEGTLCIENIHLLSLESQKLLSRFLRLGYFSPLRTGSLLSSSVRIIATTLCNLHELVNQGLFDAELAERLTDSMLTIPSFAQVDPQQYAELLHGYVYQALKSKGMLPFMGLTEEDKHIIAENNPTSLIEIKELVHKIVVQKAQHKKMEDAVVNSLDTITDPELLRAQKMGKDTLKDERLMALLWQKFNNQSHIAALLGVHRSSVHRRLKELHITHSVR